MSNKLENPLQNIDIELFQRLRDLNINTEFLEELKRSPFIDMDSQKHLYAIQMAYFTIIQHLQYAKIKVVDKLSILPDSNNWFEPVNISDLHEDENKPDKIKWLELTRFSRTFWIKRFAEIREPIKDFTTLAMLLIDLLYFAYKNLSEKKINELETSGEPYLIAYALVGRVPKKILMSVLGVKNAYVYAAKGEELAREKKIEKYNIKIPPYVLEKLRKLYPEFDGFLIENKKELDVIEEEEKR